MIGERLWTVRVQGGDPCSIRLPFGIEQDHDGGLSVWKIRGNQEQVEGILDILVSSGCKVAMYEDGQTEEQKTIRENLLGVQREGFAFRCELCPSCALFDPQTENLCGVDDWEDSMLTFTLRREKAQEDLEACPIHVVVDG